MRARAINFGFTNRFSLPICCCVEALELVVTERAQEETLIFKYFHLPNDTGNAENNEILTGFGERMEGPGINNSRAFCQIDSSMCKIEIL